MHCLALDDVAMYLFHDLTTCLATHIASGDLNVMENLKKIDVALNRRELLTSCHVWGPVVGQFWSVIVE